MTSEQFLAPSPEVASLLERGKAALAGKELADGQFEAMRVATLTAEADKYWKAVLRCLEGIDPAFALYAERPAGFGIDEFARENKFPDRVTIGVDIPGTYGLAVHLIGTLTHNHQTGSARYDLNTLDTRTEKGPFSVRFPTRFADMPAEVHHSKTLDLAVGLAVKAHEAKEALDAERAEIVAKKKELAEKKAAAEPTPTTTDILLDTFRELVHQVIIEMPDPPWVELDRAEGD